MLPEACVLVVGTTPDYIHWINRIRPGQALFLTDPTLRKRAHEPDVPPPYELLCDPHSIDDCRQAIQNHLKKYKLRIDGITCFDCETMNTAAQLANWLSLPFPTTEAIRICQDKFLSKRVWQSCKIPCPKSCFVGSPEDCLDFMEKTDGPCVLKPQNGTGSELVLLCETRTSVPEAYNLIREKLNRKDHKGEFTGGQTRIVAEEYIAGDEFSCDFLLDDTGMRIIRIAEKKRLKGASFGTTCAYLVPGSLPNSTNEEELRGILEQAARALGLKKTICMADIIITSTGPKLLELTPRPGGDCLPQIIRRACDLDILGLTIDLARGHTAAIPAPEKWSKTAGLRIHARQAGTISEVNTDEVATDPRVREINIIRKPGHAVSLPPDDYDSWYLGYVIFTPNATEGIRGPVHRFTQPRRHSYGRKIMADSFEKQIQKLASAAELSTPASLPSSQIFEFVETHFARKNEFLALADKYGSPLYIVDPAKLKEKAAAFRSVFEEKIPRPVRVYYAVKSNSNPVIAKTFLESGLGLDVSSGKELAMALELGGKDIVFSGPGKTDAELSLAVEHADKVTVLMDSFAELPRLEKLAAENDLSIRTGIRLTTNPKGLWRKFGIPLTRLDEFFTATESCPHVQLAGLQFHTSWNMNASAQSSFIAKLGETLRNCPPSVAASLRFVDIGGGYWPERGEWLQEDGTPVGALHKLIGISNDTSSRRIVPSTPIEQYATDIARAVEKHLSMIEDLTVCLEPGRWLCDEGMHLLMTVIDRKCDNLVITDAGTNIIGWERFETDFFPVLNLSNPANKELPCDVLGSLCTPHDVWGYSVWGGDIQPGDVLLIPCQGAYTYSLRQEFIKSIPETVSI